LKCSFCHNPASDSYPGEKMCSNGHVEFEIDDRMVIIFESTE
jgi:pyruvate-formate lyase-activating enzyme